MATHSSVLAGESQGQGNLVGCCLWGRTESDTTDATWQQQQQYEQRWATFHVFVGKVMSLLFSMLSQFSSVHSLSRVRLFATPWTVAYQAPLSMGFSRQEYWSGLSFLLLIQKLEN